MTEEAGTNEYLMFLLEIRLKHVFDYWNRCLCFFYLCCLGSSLGSLILMAVNKINEFFFSLLISA